MPPCASGSLQLRNPPGEIGGAEGNTVAITLENVGVQPSSLIGWPTIATPGVRSTVQYQTWTGAGFMVAVNRVVIAPGEYAATAIYLDGPPDTAGGSCSAPGHWLVTLPGQRPSISVAWPARQSPCPGGTVEVSPLYKGNEPEIGFGSAAPSDMPVLGPFSSPPPE